MSKVKSILISFFAVFAVFCLVTTADAAKGGGGCKDRDNDGYFQKAGCGTAVDCNDDDAVINPGAAEVCDGIDNNCDGTVDEGCGGCIDNDGDGYGVNGDPSCPAGTEIDCDDNDAAVNPGSLEVCGNGVDENCDGQDDICTGCIDNDGDGYGEGAGCLGPDCDDNDSSINPGASEECADDVDNNCNGDVDEGCGGCEPTAAKEKGCDCFDNTDNDCDGSIDSLDRDCKRQTCDTCFDDDGDGWYSCGGDCDDSNPAINPGAPEVCNGIDDNCDGLLSAEEQDADGDGWIGCEECNDTDPAINPGAPEVCNGIDDNCDGILPPEEQDADADGYMICAGDCNDTNPDIRPGLTYIDNPAYCSDGLDNNCDFQVDTGPECPPSPCTDLDGDGYGANGDPSCPNGTEVDCNDFDPNVNPGAPEEPLPQIPEIPGLCEDGIDNDCDGYIDLADPGCQVPSCIDSDGDGFGVNGDSSCTYPGIIDCDDTNPTINPFAPEVCGDGIDNNCDGEADGTTPGGQDMCCFDNDNDGFPGQSYCGPPEVIDCNDNDPSVSPGVVETCGDGIDNNCDGEADGTTPGGHDQCCFDNDNDGFPGQSYCGPPEVIDCNDNDPSVSPGVVETCGDGIDNNCDGEADGTTPGGHDQCCFDNDNDGFPGQSYCGPPEVIDCNDNDPSVSPGVVETCGDGIDNNCDGEADGTTPGGHDQCCFDNDNDGFPGQSYCGPPEVIDCNDNDPSVSPGVAETCGDGIDNNCDGEADGTTPGGHDQCCFDNDNDGFPGQSYCGPPEVIDCNDNDPSVSPGVAETCGDGIDNNCDGEADGTTPGGHDQCCFDNDNDGFPGQAYCGPPEVIDCNDNDSSVSPGVAETCGDGIDNNCDGEVDGTTPGGQDQCCFDNDNDGYPGQSYCGPPEVIDCDDNNPLRSPGEQEGPIGFPSCSDGIDNDCDGSTDFADPDCASPFCSDNTDCTSGTDYCEKSVGDCGGQGSCQSRPGICMPVWGPVCGCDGVTYSNDCDAAMAGVNVDYDGECNSCGAPPGDDSNCNGIDEDCDGIPDDDYVPTSTNCGVGECATIGLLECQAGTLVDNCVPLPPSTEGPIGDPTCTDGMDNDCDGLVDIADIDCIDPCTIDNDGDGFTICDGDCDDNDPSKYPGAPPVCGTDSDCDGYLDISGFEGPLGDPTCYDGIDNDCDGSIDTNDLNCQPFECGECTSDMDCPTGTICNADVLCMISCTCPDCDVCAGHCVPSPSTTYTMNITSGVAHTSGGYDGQGIGDIPVSGTFKMYIDGSDVTIEDISISDGPSMLNWNDLAGTLSGIDLYLLAPSPDQAFLDTELNGTFDGNFLSMTGLHSDPCYDCYQFNYVIDAVVATDNDGDGYPTEAGDCDDSNPMINPGADDSNCNGVDEDCDGIPDDDYVPTPTNCGIGQCVSTGLLECQAGVLVDTCVPFSPQPEGPVGDPTCSDVLDNDCDGLTDDQDLDCSGPCNDDNDGDGYCDGPVCGCGGGGIPGDCDDTDPNVCPGCPLLCDGKDNNCDGYKDFFTDEDKDGDGVVWCDGDCDDNDPNRYPGNWENAFCNPTSCSDGIDNDCDNTIDLSDFSCNADGCIDCDRDGYSLSVIDIFCPAGPPLDCDDSNPDINPGAIEGPFGDPTCSDIKDNDCDGLTDGADSSCM